MGKHTDFSSIRIKNHEFRLSRYESLRGDFEDNITMTSDDFSYTIETRDFISAVTGIILANMQIGRIESGEYPVKDSETVELCKKRVGKKTLLIEYCENSVTVSYNESLLSRFEPKEIAELTEGIICFLNDMIGIEGFDIRTINPIFLSERGTRFVHKINGIKYDEVYLEDLYTVYNDKLGFLYRCWLKESHIYKELSGLPTKNESPQINLLGQTDEERISQTLESIKQNGYPYNNEYILLFNDDFWVRDGRHRACCLLHLYGNIKVPVLRIGLREGIRNLKKATRSIVRYICQSELKGKKIAIKGGGIHTVRLLDAIGSGYDIRCVIDRKKSSQFSFPCEIIYDDELKNYDVDVVVISSYIHRQEMRKDIERLDGAYEIFDIYDRLEDLQLAIESEFYNYYNKEISWQDK